MATTDWSRLVLRKLTEQGLISGGRWPVDSGLVEVLCSLPDRMVRKGIFLHSAGPGGDVCVAGKVWFDHFSHVAGTQLASEEAVDSFCCRGSVYQAVAVLDIEHRNAANGQQSLDLGQLCLEEIGKF